MTPEIIVSLIGIFLVVCLIAYMMEYTNRKELEEYFNSKVSKPVEPSPTVTCEDCKCEIKEENAYIVKYIYSSKLYFCRKCKPNYNKICLDYNGNISYYKELEVTKDGEPVGYKKK